MSKLWLHAHTVVSYQMLKYVKFFNIEVLMLHEREEYKLAFCDAH